MLKTAVRMLQEIGCQRTTLRRISAESGVGEGELRRWYKTKDELLAAISEMLLALYQYIVPLAIALEAVDKSAMLCSLCRTLYTTSRLFELLVDRHASYAHLTFARQFTAQECYERVLVVRASLGGYIMAHDFKYLFPREQLKRLILAQALEVFQVPADRIEMLLVELEIQKKKLLEVCCQIFRPEGWKSEKC
ncbi:TetR/AcrR family transcriptional regulator [Acidaminococcus fermentans]|uniref:TetR/AcrR family transcriptional regulator n=1 Tax=Acidaminococcus fermentans TaxID=905 RepID=UPI003079F1BB